MTLTEARDFLRAELLTVAAAAVPGFEGIVAHDVGPVDPGVMSDGSGPDTVCSITIENGNQLTGSTPGSTASRRRG